MAMDEMLALPGVNVADLCIISELQKSIKANKVISYLSGKTEVKEETKGADYGGTTYIFGNDIITIEIICGIFRE